MIRRVDKADRHMELWEKRRHKLPCAIPEEQNIPYDVMTYWECFFRVDYPAYYDCLGLCGRDLDNVF